MKKILIILTILLITGADGFARDIYPYSVGPAISYKAGINAVTTPKGRKNVIAINPIPDFGARMYFPVSETSRLGVVGNIMYNNYAYNIEAVNTGNDYTHEYSYLTIGAALSFSGMYLGFDFGAPLSANFGPAIPSDNLVLMTEFKIGGEITIADDETGRMIFFARAGYMLSGIYEDFGEHDPLRNIAPTEEGQTLTNEFNPRAASIALGFSYLFTLNF